jgi:hypothetical protein
MASSSDATRHVAYAHERKRVVRELCFAARNRIAANSVSLMRARARIDRTAVAAEGARRLLGHGAPASQEPTAKVIPLPPPRADATPMPSLAPLLDFLEHRTRREHRSPDEQRAQLLLGEILWDVGEARARPLVESALALLCDSDEPAIRAEVDALRGWLVRHPV